MKNHLKILRESGEKILGFEEDSDIFSKLCRLNMLKAPEIYYPMFYGKKTSFLAYIKAIDQVYFQEGVCEAAAEFEALVQERYEE